MYRPDGRKSPACQVSSALRGVFPACEGRTSLAARPTGPLSPGWYASTPPSAANVLSIMAAPQLIKRSSLQGETSLATRPTGLVAPDRYTDPPPSTANAAGTRLSREIMVRKA